MNRQEKRPEETEVWSYVSTFYRRLKNFDETHMHGPEENCNFQHIKIDESKKSFGERKDLYGAMA